MHDHFMTVNSIVDRIRKTSRQKSVMTELNSMDSRVKDERVYLGEETVEKVASDTGLLAVIKFTTGSQILERRSKDSKSHSNRFRSSFLATSQSRTSTRPAANSASVFRSSSSCHAGLSYELSSAAMSPQRVSMILSFSDGGSFRSSAMLMVRIVAFRPNVARALSG